MSAQDLINEARNIIGKGDSNYDWKIVPTEHATLFEEKAKPLANILRKGRPQGLAEMYEDVNDRAIKAQVGFKNAVKKADIAVFCTASFAALLLVSGGLQTILGEAGHLVVISIGILGAIFSGLSAMWLSQVKGGELSKKWATERAKAEAKRLAYFKGVIEEASEEPMEQLLTFEYTRRFLLDNQIDYFRDRGIQHEDAATKALKTSTLAVFIASTFTAVAGLLSILEPGLALIAGLGVISTAYSTFVMSRSNVNLDRKNADRYRVAEEQLKERKLDIDTYLEKASSGDKEATKAFFEPIFVILETDHKGFLDDNEKREMAIGDMERRLDEAKKLLNRKPEDEVENGQT